MFAKKTLGKLEYYVVFAPPEEEVVAAYSTRRGGVSLAPYATLNLGLHVGDDPERVWENRRRFWGALGVAPEQVVAGEQIHGVRVARVSRQEAGRGSRSYADCLPGTDAMMTDEPGIALTGYFADCASVFLYDPHHRAIGLAHAGWRGTVAGVASKLLAAMGATYGTDPRQCRAFIGPAIGPCCFQVGEDVARAVTMAGEKGVDLGAALTPAERGKWRFDLVLANRLQLLAAGMPAEGVTAAGLCTACRPEFFSYRRDGPVTGRMGAVLMLRPASPRGEKRG